MSPRESSPKGIGYSPIGCNAKPIHLGTRPAERDQILGISKKLSLSIAGTARLLVLVGMEQVEEKGLEELFRVNEQDLEQNPPARNSKRDHGRGTKS